MRGVEGVHRVAALRIPPVALRVCCAAVPAAAVVLLLDDDNEDLVVVVVVADLVGGTGGIFAEFLFLLSCCFIFELPTALTADAATLAVVVVMMGGSTGVAAVVVILMDVADAVVIVVFVVMDFLHVVPLSFISICKVIKSKHYMFGVVFVGVVWCLVLGVRTSSTYLQQSSIEIFIDVNVS